MFGSVKCSVIMEEASSNALPFHEKDLIPKDRFDRGLFGFMIVGIPSFTLWELHVLFLYHSSLDGMVCIHVLAGAFILLNVFGNLYYLKRIDATGKQKGLPSVLRTGWRYCHFCKLNSPPRSYHCPVCDECVLKRDQHCMFAGCCVGFYNHRYYLLALVYIWTGAMYAAIYQWEYCFEVLGGSYLTSVLKLLAPHLAFPLGFLSFYGFIVSVIHIILLVVVILTSYLIWLQFTCIINGQTIHEKKADINTYDLGWKRNFLNVLGKNWYLTFLLPFITSPISGDGLNFLTISELEDVKYI